VLFRFLFQGNKIALSGTPENPRRLQFMQKTTVMTPNLYNFISKLLFRNPADQRGFPK
jgi:hypothetical protein